MKLKYIDIKGYGILVDINAKVKEWDYFYNELSKVIERAANTTINLDWKNKIIFAEKELNLDGVPVLPNWREWEVEQLALDKADNKSLFGDKHLNYLDKQLYKEGFVEGCSHNKAKYTEEDLRKSFRAGQNYEIEENFRSNSRAIHTSLNIR